VQRGASAFPFAICNEIFHDCSFAQGCASAAELGYEGLELAPHTLAEDATLLTKDERTRLRRTIEDAGMAFVGLHWLLRSPAGMHAASASLPVRRRTWDYLSRAVDLCSELSSGADTVMVLGSPNQRSVSDGVSPAEGFTILVDELSALAEKASAHHVSILMEAIPSAETNLVNMLAEAADVVARVGNLCGKASSVQSMFDVHNAADENESHAELIRRYSHVIRHVHVNEPDGREPGAGDYDFRSLLEVLQNIGYPGWVSVESFDFTRPSREIAARAMETLKNAAQTKQQWTST
jgi:sugar phosphate isomerase/epimerase